MAARKDEGLYAKARSLFISKATMDDFTGWATPRQTEAVSRLFGTELAKTGNARSASGSCAAPGSPSSRAWRATTSRT
mgnify:CR=1 FL=1